jgi:hypothetical protein
MEEQQHLTQLQGEQLQSVTSSIERLQQRDQERHSQFMEQMEALKTSREAMTDMVSSFEQSLAQLQEVTVALINRNELEQSGATR